MSNTRFQVKDIDGDNTIIAIMTNHDEAGLSISFAKNIKSCDLASIKIELADGRLSAYLYRNGNYGPPADNEILLYDLNTG
jgi:hypothetical protein